MAALTESVKGFPLQDGGNKLRGRESLSLGDRAQEGFVIFQRGIGNRENFLFLEFPSLQAESDNVSSNARNRAAICRNIVFFDG